VTRPLAWEQLGEADRQYLARLPLTQYLRIDGKVLLMVHATPRDPLDEYLFADEANWKRRLDQIEADIVCVGHTHHPFELHIGNTTVLNPGSVGQPRDGDPRASFAIIENGQISLHRSVYNVEHTIERLNAFDIPEAAKHLSAGVWRTGGRVNFTEQAIQFASQTATKVESTDAASHSQEEPMGTL
jgi:diadenosine tetraphosphatase ApaH/serine/threonine PP2A family protein phosphatase